MGWENSGSSLLTPLTASGILDESFFQLPSMNNVIKITGWPFAPNWFGSFNLLRKVYKSTSSNLHRNLISTSLESLEICIWNIHNGIEFSHQLWRKYKWNCQLAIFLYFLLFPKQRGSPYDFNFDSRLVR